jgi:hypothetical protein
VIQLIESSFCIFRASYCGFLPTFAPSKKKSKQMHSKSLPTSKTLRFRRWSRVGYAVFCSLACSVTIGSLSISVSDKTLQKSTSNSINNLYSCHLEFGSDENETDLSALDAKTLQQQLGILTSVATDTVAARNNIINIRNQNG